MIDISGANLLVYREGRKRVVGGDLIAQLRGCLYALATAPNQDSALTALLQAGELECALSDAHPKAGVIASITDRVAALVCNDRRGGPSYAEALRIAAESLDGISVHQELTLSQPEGFAYYALHPLDFADQVAQIELRSSSAFVVGIRSIGTTLSAVVAASLSHRGVQGSRTTVRPTGHVYQRRCGFDSYQQLAIRTALQHDAEFLICDEGPGRSGSSFLSVAEALEQAGVPRERITLLCSHQPDVDSLCAPDAARRWRRYRSVGSGLTKRLPSQAGQYLGGGEWRRVFCAHEDEWPATWAQMERLKYLGRDGRSVWKFQGHGHYGDAIHQREQLLSDSGFGVAYLGRESGFGAHQLISERAATPGDVDEALLRRLAEYCAWRSRALPASVSPQNVEELQAMATGNTESEFGWSPEIKLEVRCPTLCDGRLQPAKWRLTDTSRWVKLDASMHGDDHFFPGPTDIAWDLAGVCVEWKLNREARVCFLDEYRRLSVDDARGRIADYEFAYSAFRMAWSKMAAASTQGSDDAPRLWRDYLRYRAVLEELLRARSVSATLAA